MTSSIVDLIGSEMVGIFEGLRPGLVLNLADLDGLTLDELNVPVQKMPYGDRANLAAYDLVFATGEGAERKHWALPKLVQATRAAALSRSFWEK